MSQQNQLFKMPSGATLAVTVAPFADAWALMRASLKTLKGMGLKAEDLQQEGATLMDNPATLSLLLDRVVDFATSPDVEAALWRCAQRALYIPAGSPAEFPGEKVDQKLFDHPEHGSSAREDYAKLAYTLMEVNCKPFLAQVLSGLQKPKATSPDGQQSKLS